MLRYGKTSTESQWPKFQPYTLAQVTDRFHRDVTGHMVSEWQASSLWCWNIDEPVQVSQYGSLTVIDIESPTNGRRMRSVDAPIEEIDEAIRVDELGPIIELVPWEVAVKLGGSDVKVIRDYDRSDYVYDVEEQLALVGHRFRHRRNYLRAMERRPSHDEVELDLSSSKVQVEVLRVFDAWEESRGSPATTRERYAIERALRSAHELGLTAVGTRDEGRLMSFIIFDVADRWAHALFAKYAERDSALVASTWQAMVRAVDKCGASFINAQHDGGLEGLRQAKLSLVPSGRIVKAFLVTESH